MMKFGKEIGKKSDLYFLPKITFLSKLLSDIKFRMHVRRRLDDFCISHGRKN